MADTPPVKSAMRTLDIIEYVVASERPVVAGEIATALSIPVSSLSYLLNTLVDRRYLARDGRRYTAGAGLARLQAEDRSFSLAERVAPLVRSLRVALGETASFFVPRDWQVEAMVTETSEHALRYAVSMGTMTPMHGFAAGKAILAALPDDQVDTYLAETDRPAYTPATITDADALRREIAEIRRTGIAHTHEEHTPGIHGISRAVVAGGKVIGAFSLAIPIVRYDRRMADRAAELLRRTAALLEAE
ncbi:IclR family transcriptional regulator [Sphingomonas sp. TX0543]|uniref:IclR family transcriptional regulator n=1 Tax=unclassified Sphingomonas TaxID=196159 RepID=UPI00201618E6|nr:IclR family transcriptional regulator [Sphingomonas sp. 3P27F8]